MDVYDPLVDKDEAIDKYNIKLIDQPEENKYDSIFWQLLMTFWTLH